LLLPACVIAMLQVPLAVFDIVIVPPELVQAPVVPKLIGSPEVADATTVKVLPFTTCDGAGVVTLIVWLAWLTVWLTDPELPPWLLSPE